MSIRRAVACAALALVPVALASCLFVKAHVSRFNSFDQNIHGASFYMLPMKIQQGSAEYRQYASSIARRLNVQGMRQTENLSSADYVVIFNYGLGEKQISGSMPMWGQTGGGTAYHSGTASAFGTGGSAFGSYSGTTYTPATYGVTGYMPYSKTEYTRTLTFNPTSSNNIC